MLRTIASLGDRMVARLVPRVDVAAGPCFYRCCWRGIAQYCCVNQSTGAVSCGSCSVSYNCNQ
jgi:hypothetical protein